MGQWAYYTASMRLSEIAARVKLASDIYHSSSLSTLIQRVVTKRSKDIAVYLREQKQDRFFNALVLGVNGGNPLWHDVDLRENPYLSEEEIDRIDGQLGALVLNGAEQLYAIDGQHRVKGIQEACESDPDLGEEQLTVIFVPYDLTNAPGLRRTRRLFSTLNRYAKPVSKRDLIALDEDDTVAITTRRLVESYPLFKNERISATQAKNLAVGNPRAFTTVVALYDALENYLRGAKTRREWSKFKKFRPKDDLVLDEYYARAATLWDQVRAVFPPVDEVATSPDMIEVAAAYRRSNGGHFLFRPIGIRALIRAILAFAELGVSLTDALARLASVPMEIGDEPWAGIVYNVATRRMLTAPENQDVAFVLWFYLAGGPLAAVNFDEAKLRKELAGVTGLEEDALTIPTPLNDTVTAQVPAVPPVKRGPPAKKGRPSKRGTAKKATKRAAPRD